MDKWDDLTKRIQSALLAEEPEAVVSTGFELVCEFGRVFERIAVALEDKPAEEPSEEPPVHDL